MDFCRAYPGYTGECILTSRKPIKSYHTILQHEEEIPSSLRHAVWDFTETHTYINVFDEDSIKYTRTSSVQEDDLRIEKNKFKKH